MVFQLQTSMSGNKLFLIPTYLSDSNDRSFIAPMVIDVLKHVDHYLVENIRSARRFISSLKAGIVIDSLSFEQLDKKTSWDDAYQLFEPLRNGHDMALMSEAGLPCLADPGNIAVSLAHQTRIQVVPLPGTSSIQLALIASGFNGQQFTFHGYLPIERNDRIRRLKELEKEAAKGYTQLFMETPYRNVKLLEDILSSCRPDTPLNIAADITGNQEFIRTLPVREWQKTNPLINKLPAIFSFGQIA